MLQNALFIVVIIVSFLSSVIIYTMASRSSRSKNKKKSKGPNTINQEDIPLDGTSPGTSKWISSTQMDLLQPNERANTRSSSALKSTELLKSKLDSVDSSDSESDVESGSEEEISEKKSNHSIRKGSISEIEVSSSQESFNRKNVNNSVFDNPENSQFDPNYSGGSMYSTPRKQQSSPTTTSQHESSLADSSSFQGFDYIMERQKVMENKSNFIQDFRNALMDTTVRDLLTELLLEPLNKKIHILANKVSVLEKNCEKAHLTIKSLEKRNKKTENKVTSLEEKCATLESEITEVTKQASSNNNAIVAPIQSEISNLKHKSNMQQRMTDQERRNNLVFHGIMESKDENKKDLNDKVKNILDKADLKIEGSFEVARLGKIISQDNETSTQRPRPVKVILSNYWDKRIIYNARITMKAKGNHGIFINEDLPKIQQTLLMHCREARRQNKIDTCWTDEGVVHVRTADKDDLIMANVHQLIKDTGYKEKKSQN
jgi:uncharacterized protein (UPF0335 family)